MSILNLNKVILAGHITGELELKQTPNGISTTTFSIAVNRRMGKNGQRETDFINIVAWRATAEFVCRYFKKGSAICVVGAIQTRSWQDQQGNKRYATEIVADEAYFVDGKTDAQTENNAQNEASQLSVLSYTTQNASKFETLRDDDDPPF